MNFFVLVLLGLGVWGLVFFYCMVFVFFGGIFVDSIFMGIKLMKKYLFVFFIIFLLGCVDLLLEDSLDYVGEWCSKEMGLLIFVDGFVFYKWLEGGVIIFVSGFLKCFEGDDFVVGVFFMIIMFDVMELLYEIGGVWMMIVDGVWLMSVSD